MDAIAESSWKCKVQSVTGVLSSRCGQMLLYNQICVSKLRITSNVLPEHKRPESHCNMLRNWILTEVMCNGSPCDLQAVASYSKYKWNAVRISKVQLNWVVAQMLQSYVLLTSVTSVCNCKFCRKHSTKTTHYSCDLQSLVASLYLQAVERSHKILGPILAILTPSDTLKIRDAVRPIYYGKSMFWVTNSHWEPVNALIANLGARWHFLSWSDPISLVQHTNWYVCSASPDEANIFA